MIGAEEAVSPVAVIVVLLVLAVIIVGGIYAIVAARKIRVETDARSSRATGMLAVDPDAQVDEDDADES